MVYSDLSGHEAPVDTLPFKLSRDRRRLLHPRQGGIRVHMRRRMNRSIIGQKLKALREDAKLSMRELAARSGTSVSLISKIEAGTVSPTVLSLQKIVESMDMELYEFFLDQNNGDPTQTIVFKKQDMVVSGDEERTWRYAFPKHPDIKAQLSYEEYDPHSKPLDKITHKGDILGFVISGELTLDINGLGAFRASSGDAFYIRAGQAHEGHNESEKPLKIVLVQLRV